MSRLGNFVGLDFADISHRVDQSETLMAYHEQNSRIPYFRCVNAPGVLSSSPIVKGFYGGNNIGSDLADILFGAANPPVELARKITIKTKSTELIPDSPDIGKRLENSLAHPSLGDNSGDHHESVPQ